MAGDCTPLEGAGAREVLVRWEEGAGRAELLPCWLRADTMGGRVVEMATGVASGTLLPGFVSTFTCNKQLVKEYKLSAGCKQAPFICLLLQLRKTTKNNNSSSAKFVHKT